MISSLVFKERDPEEIVNPFRKAFKTKEKD